MKRVLVAAVVFALFAGVAFLLLRPPVEAVTPVGPYDAPATPKSRVPGMRATLGAASCTSSGCHAGAPGAGEPWTSAYTVWALEDPHSRAERVLHGELAARIVAGIAATDPGAGTVAAPGNRACTGCHAPLGPLSGAAADPRAAEGVSCEACHGPAGDWLVAHSLPGWRTAGDRAGMIDLGDPSVCADRCAECHIGAPPTEDGRLRQVTHALVAAGHPRLSFEVRSFRAGLPSHWRDAAAFAARAAAEGGHRAEPFEEWSLGRLATLRAYLLQVERQSTVTEAAADDRAAPAWPEFTAFDCYGCHRPLPVRSADAGRGESASPGLPRPDPLVWGLLDLVVPPDELAAVEGIRARLAARWRERPARDPIAAAVAAVDRVRAGGNGSTGSIAPARLAERVAAGADLREWGEAAAALAALEAIAARAGEPCRNAVAADLGRLEELLAFPVEEGPEGTVRHDSPRPFDREGVAGAVRRIVEGIANAGSDR